jgi:hypothetical protein
MFYFFFITGKHSNDNNDDDKNDKDVTKRNRDRKCSGELMEYVLEGK